MVTSHSLRAWKCTGRNLRRGAQLIPRRRRTQGAVRGPLEKPLRKGRATEGAATAGVLPNACYVKPLRGETNCRYCGSVPSTIRAYT